MRRSGIVIITLALGAGFVWALFSLLSLEYESGKNLPAHSSLRKDPMGTSALYEALDALPGVTAARNRLPLDSLTPDRAATWTLVGMPPEMPLDLETVEALERWVRVGSRLVITFDRGGTFTAPDDDADESTDNHTGEDEDDSEKGDEGGGKDSPSVQEAMNPIVRLGDRWDFTWSYDESGVTMGDENLYLVQADDAPAPLPVQLPWRGAAAFKDWDEAWRAVYTRGSDRAAVLERDLGRGTIVLATDSYLLTNEGLRVHREPAYLAWLIGPHDRVVFDESHLGLTPQVGVATLVRRYGLAPLFVAFALVFGLFVWHSATALVPRPGDVRTDEALQVDKGASAALTSLLRRSTRPRQLVQACVNAWLETARWRGGADDEVRADVAAAGGGHSDAVAGYRRIQTLLEERKRSR